MPVMNQKAAARRAYMDEMSAGIPTRATAINAPRRARGRERRGVWVE